MKCNNLRRHWEDFREKQTAGENLFIYGWGDGGGGPTREMVEASLRTEGSPACPERGIDICRDVFPPPGGEGRQTAGLG